MASSNGSEASSGDFPSYAGYVHALARINPKFEWLSRFFAHIPPVSTLTGEVSIMTSENGTLTDEVFSEDLLLSSPKPGTTRLIIISYEETWTIDRDILDRVAMALNVPPYFLMQHFDYEDNEEESNGPLDRGDWYEHKARMPLPSSQTLSLELGVSRYLHLSGMLVSSSSTHTGAILLALVRKQSSLCYNCLLSHTPGPVGVTLSDMKSNPSRWQHHGFKDSLSLLSCSALDSANLTSYDYFIPWIRLIRDQFASLLQQLEHFLRPFFDLRERDKGDEDDLEKILSGIEYYSIYLDRSLTNLDNFLQSHLNAKTPAMTAATKDLGTLQIWAEKLHKRGQTLINRRVATLALLESRKSIDQAESTKRLTQLAYIFLPLSLSASIFGMIVTEVQNTRIRAFFVTAALGFATSLILWWFLGWLLRPGTRSNTKGIAIVTYYRLAIIIYRLFWRAPDHALFMLLFVTCHSTTMTWKVIHRFELWDVLGNRKKSSNTPLPSGFSIGQRSIWSKFWNRRLMKLATFTYNPGWEDQYFWQRQKSPRARNTGSC